MHGIMRVSQNVLSSIFSHHLERDDNRTIEVKGWWHFINVKLLFLAPRRLTFMLLRGKWAYEQTVITYVLPSCFTSVWVWTKGWALKWIDMCSFTVWRRILFREREREWNGFFIHQEPNRGEQNSYIMSMMRGTHER